MFNFNLSTAIGRFRLIAFIEGLSYILLLFIAMPLKYGLNFPEAVKYTGWVHGLFFVLYQLALIQNAILLRWNLLKIAGAFIASILPFGTFVLDAKLLKSEEEKHGNKS
jgi:integral membrane protein